MKKSIDQAIRLLRILVEGREVYFSGDYLNSEGRKLLEEAVRNILRDAPFLKRRVVKVRKKGDYDSVLSLVEDLLSLQSSEDFRDP
ncbi:hypothetical protein [Thermogladius sp.]|uniref:hypothetical protein n=1 Tax=Thermogladius sp. TaxID=2023064 RepID=UPI003D13A62B